MILHQMSHNKGGEQTIGTGKLVLIVLSRPLFFISIRSKNNALIRKEGMSDDRRKFYSGSLQIFPKIKEG